MWSTESDAFLKFYRFGFDTLVLLRMAFLRIVSLFFAIFFHLCRKQTQVWEQRTIFVSPAGEAVGAATFKKNGMFWNHQEVECYVTTYILYVLQKEIR